MKSVIFDDVVTPTDVDYFYTLNLDLDDYTLSSLLTLEEIIAPAFEIDINGFRFFLPTCYHILVFSNETLQVDTVKIHELTNTDFSVLVYNNSKNKITDVNLHMINYIPEMKFVSPHLLKHEMLCHPISPDSWINITPYDQYKLINNKVIGDFMV